VFDGGWLSEQARRKVKDGIVALESRSGAEVVVTVRSHSGHYRHADYLFGAIASLALLAVYLYYPAEFADDIAALVMVAGFGVGAFFCAAVSPLRRLLVSRRLMDDAVGTAARSRFVLQGISRTRDRIGVLIFVSLFERRAEVVADIGIPITAMGQAWQQAVEAIHVAVARGKGVDSFLTALSSLGDVLERAVPRRADDVNELADDVVGT
jgi:putative membrane protein